MARMTQQTEEGGYILDRTYISDSAAGFQGEAVEKLARLENLVQQLKKEQEELAGKMESLRSEGKMKSVQFRECMVKKLANANTISLLEIYRLV